MGIRTYASVKKQCNKRVSALQQKQRERFGKANKVMKEIMRSTSVLCATGCPPGTKRYSPKAVQYLAEGRHLHRHPN